MSFCSSCPQFHKQLEVNSLLRLNTLHFSDETFARKDLNSETERRTAMLIELRVVKASTGIDMLKPVATRSLFAGNSAPVRLFNCRSSYTSKREPSSVHAVSIAPVPKPQ